MPELQKYGHRWPAGTTPLQIEFWAIRQGKQWCEAQGRSLFYHYQEAQKLLWPKDDIHTWSELLLRRFLEYDVCVILGCGASNKTYSMAKYALTDWWAFPNDTLWLLSSTEYRGADLRIWGDIQLLFNRAMKLHDYLPGYPLLSLHAIVADEGDADEEDDFFKAARSLKRGLMVVPNKKGNVSVGLAPFVGVRVPRLRHGGDEVQFLTGGWSDAYSNWYGNSDFRGVCCGNPVDVTDPLCTLATPIDGGWDHFVDTGTTQEWKSKFFNAHVVALDGRDSPNGNSVEAETNPKYPYLIGPKKLKAVAETFGKDSWQWYSQCVGKPNKSGLTNRILTRQMCEEHMAFEQVMWLSDDVTWVYGLDPSYGGSDKCIGIPIGFGMDSDRNTILAFSPPETIPIKPMLRKFDHDAEMQVAIYVRSRLAQLGIPVKNCFYDSTGKGTLGYAFAQVFGAESPVPIDSGAQPTSRPVRFDLFVDDIDAQERRLKRCDEHYSKGISEFWFSLAEAVRSKQVRQLPDEVVKQFGLRTYRVVKGNRIEIEPKSGTPHKPGFKERFGYSPNEADAAAIAVEGARRLGFQIKRIGGDKVAVNASQKAIDILEHDIENSISKFTLIHV